MAEPTVAAGFTKALLDLAASKGADRRRLIERSGVDPLDLQDQDNRVPLANHLALMNTATGLCNDPAFALHFGAAFSTPELSIVGLIGQAAATVTEAFEQTNRYARLMLDADEGAAVDAFEIIRDQDGAWVTLTSRLYVDHPQLTESAFARCVSSYARGFGDEPFAKAIHFTHAEPSYRAEYDRIFKVPVVFGSDRNAMLVEESFLSSKLSPSTGYVFGILSEHAEALLRDLESSRTMKGKVESLLIPILHTGDLGMERVAAKLGLSRQTLYRKLKAEGASYETLLDRLRHRMALHYLVGKKASVNETAYLVGFSEPSAFSRAFKRWTGNSPRCARKARLQG